jgi:hypothetical protein
MIKKSLSLLAIALMALMSVGCCHATRLNVTVELDPAMKQRLVDLSNRSIEVDLVAVNSTQHKRWENYSMDQYWNPPFELKNSAVVHAMTLDPSHTSVTLTAKDPIWDKWLANGNEKDVMRLYVLASLPGTIGDKPGDSDPRRQILPLSSCRWSSTDVKLVVQKTGIVTVTAPKPEN